MLHRGMRATLRELKNARIGRAAVRHDDIWFRTESFCGLLAETALSAPSPAKFLDDAVNFANTVVAGNLCASLSVRDLSTPAVSAAVDRAIARLQYGTVTVNVFPVVAYYLQSLPWGRLPG
jgi:acyl-CoA reductase-like NAD-dependent aldehyde dehydrogenase